MLELTFLVFSVKEKKYFSKIENFIKFYVGAHIFGDFSALLGAIGVC